MPNPRAIIKALEAAGAQVERKAVVGADILGQGMRDSSMAASGLNGAELKQRFLDLKIKKAAEAEKAAAASKEAGVATQENDTSKALWDLVDKQEHGSAATYDLGDSKLVTVVKNRAQAPQLKADTMWDMKDIPALRSSFVDELITPYRNLGYENSGDLDTVLDHARFLSEKHGQPDFADLFRVLSRKVGDTKYSAVDGLAIMDESGVLKPVNGLYNNNPRIVRVNSDVAMATSYRQLRLLGHEGLHAWSYRAMRKTPGFLDDMTNILAEVKAANVKSGLNLKPYGITNEDELVSEMYTNVGFQHFLKSLGMWDKAVDATAKHLGVPASVVGIVMANDEASPNAGS